LEDGSIQGFIWKSELGGGSREYARAIQQVCRRRTGYGFGQGLQVASCRDRPPPNEGYSGRQCVPIPKQCMSVRLQPGHKRTAGYLNWQAKN